MSDRWTRIAELAVHGPRDATFRWASVTKLLTGLAVLVAVEEGTVRSTIAR